MPDAAPTVGLDVGATLCKLAVGGPTLATEHHPSDDLIVVRRRVESLSPARVVATGGGASELGAAQVELLRRHGVPCFNNEAAALNGNEVADRGKVRRDFAQ